MKKIYKKQEINIRISKKKYLFIKEIINKYKKIYQPAISKLKQLELNNLDKFNYDIELTIIDEYNKLIKKILKSLLQEFKIFKLFNVSIFVTGSIARITNRLNSDIDIHFIYPNIYKPIVWKYEEIYFYIVSKVIGLKRNNLHSVITTKLSKKKLDYFDNLNDNQKLTVRLINEDYYQYEFFPTTKKRFFLQYDNSKTYKAFNKYIKNEIQGLNREWAHNFYPINNNKQFNQNYHQLLKYENKILNNEKLKQLISIQKDKINSKIKIENDISTIKKQYQQQAFYNIYNTLNIIRMYNNINYQEKVTYFNINDIFKTQIYKQIDTNNKIEYNIYKYLWIVKKISVYCERHSIPYSIHKSQYVNIPFLKEVRKDLNIINKDLINILNIIERNI